MPLFAFFFFFPIITTGPGERHSPCFVSRQPPLQKWSQTKQAQVRVYLQLRAVLGYYSRYHMSTGGLTIFFFFFRFMPDTVTGHVADYQATLSFQRGFPRHWSRKEETGISRSKRHVMPVVVAGDSSTRWDRLQKGKIESAVLLTFETRHRPIGRPDATQLHKIS